MMEVKPTISWICGVALILLISSITVIESKPKIRFVSVMFRHGNAAPDTVDLYPKDPYINNTFYPVGLGGLTNAGKTKMYKLGKILRKRYNDFLGQMYIPRDVEARSSDVPPTKTSLQLVLAGLYPPRGIQIWEKSLNWQPIVTEHVPVYTDQLFAPPFACPKYKNELIRVNSSSEFEEINEEFRPAMEKLTNHTGQSIQTLVDMVLLYHGLKAEESMHLKLPKWTRNFFPKGPLLEAAKRIYRFYFRNIPLLRLSGGVLLKRIIDDMKAVAENRSSPKALKITLFSGHEYNVAALLSALGLFKPHVPEYSSAVIIELIRSNKVHYVRIIRYLGTPSKFKVEKLPKCNDLCPLDTFIELMGSVTPLDVKKECRLDS